MSPTTVRSLRHAAWLAPVLWIAALAVAGARLDDYSQARHPVALLGGVGIPGATAFNVTGFVLPGLLVAIAAVALRGGLDGAHWAARIGARLLMLSGLAFASQGVLPLDPSDLDADASRWHAAAWTLWWVAMLPALALLAARDRGMLSLLLAGAAAFVLCVLFATPAITQRVATLAWFACGVSAMRLSRSAASSPGSSPTART